MASQVFNKIVADAMNRGVVLDRSRESVQWLRNRASAIPKTSVTVSKMLHDEDQTRIHNTIMPGHMYMFAYEAKHAATLPYYDQFPLIFPFRKVHGGFYGINLHYLPIRHRALLMDALVTDLTSDKRFDHDTRLRMNYKILNSASKYRFFEPCVKHYLNRQLQSRFIHIRSSEWQIAAFLPTQRFVGATTKKVWQDSRNVIGKI